MPRGGLITRARIENALDILAGIIRACNDEDAATLAPIYDRLENELAAMDRSHDIKSRVDARLSAREARQ